MKPLSWSELNTYETDFIDWYTSYILGIKRPSTDPQNRGTDIHCILQSLGREQPKRLYTKSEERIHGTILDGFKLFMSKAGISSFESEVEVITPIAGYPTKGYWDGYDARSRTLIEIKTGAQLWDKQRAEGHGQLHFYDAASISFGRPIDRIYLFTACTRNGRTFAHEVEPSEEKRKEIEERISKAFESFGKYRDLRI